MQRSKLDSIVVKALVIKILFKSDWFNSLDYDKLRLLCDDSVKYEVQLPPRDKSISALHCVAYSAMTNELKEALHDHLRQLVGTELFDAAMEDVSSMIETGILHGPADRTTSTATPVPAMAPRALTSWFGAR